MAMGYSNDFEFIVFQDNAPSKLKQFYCLRLYAMCKTGTQIQY